MQFTPFNSGLYMAIFALRKSYDPLVRQQEKDYSTTKLPINEEKRLKTSKNIHPGITKQRKSWNVIFNNAPSIAICPDLPENGLNLCRIILFFRQYYNMFIVHFIFHDFSLYYKRITTQKRLYDYSKNIKNCIFTKKSSANV